MKLGEALKVAKTFNAPVYGAVRVTKPGETIRAGETVYAEWVEASNDFTMYVNGTTLEHLEEQVLNDLPTFDDFIPVSNFQYTRNVEGRYDECTKQQ